MAVKYTDGLPATATENSNDSYDVCIIGAGPVGLTLAAELAESGIRIAVLESGTMKTTDYGNALRAVKNLGEIATKPSSRERVLGGAGTTWGGGSAPMDPIDLEFRPFLTHSVTSPCGWPVSAAELAPYYERSTKYGFPPLSMFENADGMAGLIANSPRLQGKKFVASVPPWDFVKRLQWIFYSRTTDLFLDATILSLQSERDSTGAVKVTGARVRSGRGTSRTIFAKNFVIAASGLESARLLLLSRDTSPQGLGNEHDQVGRYLMNHPKGNAGLLRLSKKAQNLPYPFGNSKSGWVGYTGLRLAEETQRSLSLLNSYFRLEPVFPWTGNKGVKALKALVKREPSPEFGLLRTIFSHLPTVLAYISYHLSGKNGWRAKAAQLRNFMEMEPRAENRLTLANETDINGQPLPAINISTSLLDRKSLIELHRIFAEEMQKNNIGTLESNLASTLENGEPWPITFDASHHLGGAVMGKNPKTSVVDATLRVHSVPNLYVCGGAVFPTSGCANPTYAMCALAIRLADTLKEKLGVKNLPPETRRKQKQNRKAKSAQKIEPQKIIVIGAGKRAQDDVIPALEATGKFEISGVYAQVPRNIYLGPKRYSIAALQNLPKHVVRKAAWIYVGVPIPHVGSVLAFLEKFNTKNIGLILDTPVFPKKYLNNKKYFKNFAQVVAAEDAAYLPWIPAARQSVGGEITEILLNQSAYQYHGIALMKTLMRDMPITSARLKKQAGKKAVVLTFSSAGKKAQATMLEPRDYKKGTITLSGPAGSITDDPASTNIAKMRPIIRDGLCVGLDIAGARLDFTAEQSHLIGLVPNDATITSLTLELKRLGLVTLLSGLIDNPTQIRNIESALADARLDERVHSFGKWFNAA